MDLSDVKKYLRIDDDLTEDDELVQSLITGAQEYITNQTGKQYQADSEIWNICIKLLCSHWYDNRQLNPSKPGMLSEYPHSVTALIHHIALCSSYPVVTS